MSLFNVFKVAGSGMNAQTVRLNTTASNIANADTVSSSVNETYRARHPVFATLLSEEMGDAAHGVQVVNIVKDQAPLRQEYRPGHPQADANGYVYLPNVSIAEEMANMISASRSYETNAEVVSTAKQMLMRTLQLGQ
ncbi:MAG: flagellar basal body rod protein FlgC [Pseudomonadota bacterium]